MYRGSLRCRSSCLLVSLTLGVCPVTILAQTVEGHALGSQVRDAQGRGAYIVDFKRGVADGLPSERRDAGRFAYYHRGQVVNLVEEMEWTHRVHAISMTSWSSTSFTAYLTKDQLEEIKGDPRVEGVVPDTYMTFSADPDTTAIWTDSATTSAAPPGSLWSNRLSSLPAEIRPWGQAAVNNSSISSNGRAIVYVVDSGISQHEDLNIIGWINGANPANAECRPNSLPICTTAIMPRVVGCYTHSTAVAGIIGAKINGVGIKGINPNTKIVSVSVLDPANANTRCIDQDAPIGHDVRAALDYVANDIFNNFTGIPRVVNLSINWGPGTGFTTTDASNVKADIAAIATATPGALVVQSAGNNFADACAYAYNTPNSNDGVVVVGAINNHGQPVVPLNGARGFWREWIGFGHDFGSNFNPPAPAMSCVDTWAPGDVNLVPVGDLSTANNGNVVYHSYAYGGGTSFAAPHVAGLAAYLVDTTNAATAKQLEQQVRAKFFSLGSKAPSTSAPVAMHLANGSTITIPSQTPLGVGVPRQTPYAELYLGVRGRCAYGAFATSTPPGCGANDNIGANQGINDPDPMLSGARNRSNPSSLGATISIAFDSYGLPPYTCNILFSDGVVDGPILDAGTQPPYKNFPFHPDNSKPLLLSRTCPSARVDLSY